MGFFFRVKDCLSFMKRVLEDNPNSLEQTNHRILWLLRGKKYAAGNHNIDER